MRVGAVHARVIRMSRVQVRFVQVILLIGWLDSDDQVGAVGDHHVRDLIQSLAGHFDPVHFDDLVVDGQ